MTSPTGWYVRVTTTHVVQGERVTMLYLAGYPRPKEAEEAVRAKRSTEGERYDAVEMAVPGKGPQPEPGDVRELTGAI